MGDLVARAPGQLDDPGTKTVVWRRRRIKRYTRPPAVRVSATVTEASAVDGELADKVDAVAVPVTEDFEVSDVPRQPVEVMDAVVRYTPTTGGGPTGLHLHLGDEGSYRWTARVTDWTDRVSMDPDAEPRWERLP